MQSQVSAPSSDEREGRGHSVKGNVCLALTKRGQRVPLVCSVS